MSSRVLTADLTPDPDFSMALQQKVVSDTKAHVTRWRPGDALGFNVVEVTTRNAAADSTVVYPMSFDYRIDPLVILRLRVLSAVTRRRVVGVETPGVTMNFDHPAETMRSTVPRNAIWAAMRSDIEPMTRLQFQAIEQTVGVPTRVRVVGESLGAQFGSTLALQMPTESIDVVEPVNATRLSVLAAPRVFRALGGIEESRRTEGLAESRRAGWRNAIAFERTSTTNETVDRKLKSFCNQGRWALLAGMGLRRPLVKTLSRVDLGVSIGVWRAADSLVCSETAVSHMVRELQATGLHVEQYELRARGVDAGHHLLSHLPAMVRFSELLRERWAEKTLPR